MKPYDSRIRGKIPEKNEKDWGGRDGIFLGGECLAFRRREGLCGIGHGSMEGAVNAKAFSV